MDLLQRDVLLAAVRDRLGWAIETPAGGLSAWAQMPEGSATALADAAPGYGVLVAAGPRLSPDGALDRYVRLPFSMATHVLVEAVDRLALVQDHLAGGHPRAREPLL